MMKAALPLHVNRETVNRIAYLLDRTESSYGTGASSDDSGTLSVLVGEFVEKETGNYLVTRSQSLRDAFRAAARYSSDMGALLSATVRILGDRPRPQCSSGDFVAELNRILREGELPVRWGDHGWCAPLEMDADGLLRDVLLDRSLICGCQRGDVQVEMVASSAQVMLGVGTTIVDYGAGLGRVGDGLSTAREFAFARYVAVDDPISDDLRRLVESFGGACTVMERGQFLRQPVEADVVLVVNTLHHIPFRDIPAQFAALFRALRPHGILVVHEMGTLDPLEQRNVPWTSERIVELLECDGLRVVPRSTSSKGRGVPLAHVIVHAVGSLDRLEEDLSRRADRVWLSMKRETCAAIQSFYARGSEADLPALRRATIHNANLDVNPPPSPVPWE